MAEMNSFSAPRLAASLTLSSNRYFPTPRRLYRESTKSMERFRYCSLEPPYSLSSVRKPTRRPSAYAPNTWPPALMSQARYLVICSFFSSFHWRTALVRSKDHCPSFFTHIRW